MASYRLPQSFCFTSFHLLSVPFLAGLLVFCVLSSVAAAEEPDCLKCHQKLVQQKTVHPAVPMGCPTCHSGIDARTTPHKKTTKISRGLSAEQPELCYTCHDKAAFEKKTVHAAVGMGCTGCHNPHASKNAKLLVNEAPALCMGCHDKAEFSRPVVHAPAAGGMCLQCHRPHASDEASLLTQNVMKLCLECHPDVPKRPHAVAGFSASGHPLGGKGKKDPKRSGKLFTCVSCHQPHSAKTGKLFRYDATSTMGLCVNCHKM